MEKFMNWLKKVGLFARNLILGLIVVAFIGGLIYWGVTTNSFVGQLVIFAIIVVGYLSYRFKWRQTQPKDGDEKKETQIIFRLGWFKWNFLFRPIVSVLPAIVITAFLWGVVQLVGWWLSANSINLPLLFWLIALALVTTAIAAPDGGEEVPGTNFLALVTWKGMTCLRLPGGFTITLYRMTAKYGWTGKHLGFDRSHKLSKNLEFTDDQGFIKGEVPFDVWNEPDSKEKDTDIMAPAKNRAMVKGKLTLNLLAENPRLALDSDDPALAIGQRARQEFRETIGHFPDTDAASLHQDLGEVLTGEKLVTSFLPKSVKGQKSGAMIRDNGEKAMFRLIPTGSSPEEEAAIINEFRKDLLARADRTMLKEVMEETGGVTAPKLDFVKVLKPVQEIIKKFGYILDEAIIGELLYSEPVQTSANKASSEQDQRTTQLESARTNKAARKEMLPDEEELKNPAWETAMLMQAAADNDGGNFQVVVVPGADPLTKAAVAAATQVGKGKK